MLELEGQFELLQPYFTDTKHPALEIAGWCHSKCLSGSQHAATWTEWRIGHFTGGRGYAQVGTFDGWHVLRPSRPGRWIAFHDAGCSSRFEPGMLKQAKRTDGGRLIPLKQEMHLEFDDHTVVDLMKQKLTVDQSITIEAVLVAIEITDRVQWPQALANARFKDSKKLHRDWGSLAVAAIAEYAQYIPDVIVDGIAGLKIAE